MALTVVPCALCENGHLKGITYVVWANPMPEGGDPASFAAAGGCGAPRPAPGSLVCGDSTFRGADSRCGGQPAGGVVGVAADDPPTSPRRPRRKPPEIPRLRPFGSRLDSAPVQAAVAAVREASSEERYDRLIDLMRVLRSGDVR